MAVLLDMVKGQGHKSQPHLRDLDHVSVQFEVNSTYVLFL